MKKKDKSIEEDIISNRIKNLKLDEPSADFTKKVMELVTLEALPEKNQRHRYWWLLVLVPAILVVAVGWYVIALYNLDVYLLSFWKPLQNIIQLFVIEVKAWLSQIKNINIHSVVLFGFLAIMTLLSIDEYVGKMKGMAHKSQGASL